MRLFEMPLFLLPDADIKQTSLVREGFVAPIGWFQQSRDVFL
jgi:hypothetical protein